MGQDGEVGPERHGLRVETPAEFVARLKRFIVLRKPPRWDAAAERFARPGLRHHLADARAAGGGCVMRARLSLG
jgi:hypothetical protein